MTQREEEVLKSVVEVIRSYLNPGRIILFGSRGKGRSYRNSDFDLAVDRERVDIRKMRRIMEEIDKIAGLYKVDIVFLDSVDKEFRDIILRTGMVIYDRRDQICD